MNETTRTSPESSNHYNSNFNAYIPQWNEEITSEEEDILMRKCRRKNNIEIIDKEVKESSSEVKDIRIRKCIRKTCVDIING